MTSSACQRTSFDLPSRGSPYSGSELDDELLQKFIADSKRFTGEKDHLSSTREEGSGEITWSSSHNRQQVGFDDVVLPFSKRLPREVDTRSFSPSSEWEGYVEVIGEEEFTVRLVNVKSRTSLPEDVATFNKSELSQRDRNLLALGAIVRWMVGMERLPTDQRRRVSELHFRNLPAHSTRDYDRARSKAKDLLASITWNEGS